MPARRVYRRPAPHLLGPFFGLAPGLLFLAPATTGAPLFALGVVPFAILAYRIFRIGVYVEQQGVTIRDISRTRGPIAWNEIERFGWGTRRGRDIGGAYLVGGAFTAATSLSPPFEAHRGDDKSVPRALAALNEELAHHRSSRAQDTGPDATASPDQLRLPTSS